MKTVEIPSEALKSALTEVLLGVGFIVVAGLVLTVPASVCLFSVLLVAVGAAAVSTVGVLLGEAERGDD